PTALARHVDGRALLVARNDRATGVRLARRARASHSLRTPCRAALLHPMWLAPTVVFAYAVHRTAYSIEARDPFCVPCALCRREPRCDRASWRSRPLGGRHGSCLWCVIMSGAARHRDGWSPVFLLAAFFVLTLGSGAASPAVGGGHVGGHGGGFAGGGHPGGGH